MKFNLRYGFQCFVGSLFRSGLSDNPNESPSFGAIFENLEQHYFKIMEGVDFQDFHEFVESVKSRDGRNDYMKLKI
jgi:hypothetical protein